jgi:hypothetical protein
MLVLHYLEDIDTAYWRRNDTCPASGQVVSRLHSRQTPRATVALKHTSPMSAYVSWINYAAIVAEFPLGTWIDHNMHGVLPMYLHL